MAVNGNNGTTPDWVSMYYSGTLNQFLQQQQQKQQQPPQLTRDQLYMQNLAMTNPKLYNMAFGPGLSGLENSLLNNPIFSGSLDSVSLGIGGFAGSNPQLVDAALRNMDSKYGSIFAAGGSTPVAQYLNQKAQQAYVQQYNPYASLNPSLGAGFNTGFHPNNQPIPTFTQAPPPVDNTAAIQTLTAVLAALDPESAQSQSVQARINALQNQQLGAGNVGAQQPASYYQGLVSSLLAIKTNLDPQSSQAQAVDDRINTIKSQFAWAFV